MQFILMVVIFLGLVMLTWLFSRKIGLKHVDSDANRTIDAIGRVNNDCPTIDEIVERSEKSSPDFHYSYRNFRI